MESFEDSNVHSLSNSFSLYERYLRSFSVVNRSVHECDNIERSEPVLAHNNCEYEGSNSRVNIDLSAVLQSAINKHCETADQESNLLNTCDVLADKGSSLDTDLCVKIDSPCSSLPTSLLENSSATVEHSLNEKSDPDNVPVSSEDFKSEGFKQPIFITSTMENSNNAVDSVPMFRDVRHSESVFKLPIRELSFNGTLKHVQKLKPIVDPITAFSSNTGLVSMDEKSVESCVEPFANRNINIGAICDSSDDQRVSDVSSDTMHDGNRERASECSGDSQYEEFNGKKECNESSNSKWHLDQSSSLEASFDSGVRSPDMFSDEDDGAPEQAPEPFWAFLKDFETHDKRKVRKIEETLQGVLPPPSVTILKTDVTEMLKKYFCFLPAFENNKMNPEANATTPTKRVSFVEIPECVAFVSHEGIVDRPEVALERPKSSLSKDDSKSGNDLDTSTNDKSIHFNMCTEVEAKETSWPEITKCKYYDVYYNITKYSEKIEALALRYGERFVGAETDTSVNIYSGGLQSPSSASKRKELRLKMAQAKSPGRRLSHLARRRQAFCSAATINEKAQGSSAKMVLIDKNFFPHRKLVNSGDRKSPRTRRTPGKKTPTRKTPGKKTPAKTPKTRSGGSSRKKAMRRLLMDPETLTRSQPTRDTLKRALFISPENRRAVPPASSTSVPTHTLKTRRTLFGSPDRADTKSADGTQSDVFLKRKRDTLDDIPETSRSKIAKSLSFGGDNIGSSQSVPISRRASEVFAARNSAELNEIHKKKLVWAVSEALRAHGWRMWSAGFRDKASQLARLTRRLLALPPHAASLAAPHRSTSDMMLKLARQYVFAIIQGRTVDECYQEEQMKLANDASGRMTGYISAQAYQQLQAKHTATSQIKENTFSAFKQEQPKSVSKNILQDKLVNIDTNSNSSGLSLLDKPSLGLFKSNSMPSFEEAAKMRARRQISFDNVDFPKR